MVSFPSDVGLSILKAWKRSEWQGAYDSPGRPGLGFRTALGQTWVSSDFGPLLSENPQHAATGPPVGNQLLISFSVPPPPQARAGKGEWRKTTCSV